MQALKGHSDADGVLTPHTTAGHPSATPSISQDELSVEEEFMNPKRGWH